MFTDVHKVAGEIVDFLKTRTGPVSIKEINGYTAAPPHMINRGIGVLVRENLIRIEVHDGENVMILVHHEASLVS